MPEIREFRFACQDDCGKCCYGPGHVFMFESELRRIVKYLIEAGRFADVVAFRPSLRYNNNGSILLDVKGGEHCALLDPATKRCTIYAVRPLQCRTFPFWPLLMSNEQAWNDEAERCPGINTGRLYSIEEAAQISKGNVD